ncbi:hypothetical protein Y032_0197g1566 [Ancylostoma ceylanicum]|uniref:Uncharacterized protein n=1 Tax=Ancylostoma ceylanicum TaxID=53326 RepID=A0A016SP46_9BILA|nr:hypothetical protein Y032_0197g1566 [Ancylostoma ceylanicum]
MQSFTGSTNVSRSQLWIVSYLTRLHLLAFQPYIMLTFICFKNESNSINWKRAKTCLDHDNWRDLPRVGSLPSDKIGETDSMYVRISSPIQ